MRHLMSPLDFTVEELDKLFDLAGDIERNPEKYANKCERKNWPPAFTSQAPVPDSALRRPCTI